MKLCRQFTSKYIRILFARSKLDISLKTCDVNVMIFTRKEKNVFEIVSTISPK